jgi:Holliday junction resolvase-like predicted endonuclease
MHITKATGEKEKFSKEKLCNSIVAAGAPRDLAEGVCELVKRDVKPSMDTNHLFRRALSHLVKKDIDIAVRYSLRRGLERLGPSGFLFEQYVEAVFQAHGYKTKRNQMIQGACVDHEIDVLLEEGKRKILVEVKYRNEPGTKTHLDTVMYADARRTDIQEYQKKKGEQYDVWLVTNTKFTDKAIQYGECKNQMKLIGWDYPKQKGLEDMIVEKKVFPVTALPYITNHLLKQFAEAEIILVSDLIPYSEKDLVKKFGMTEKRARSIMKRVREITN